MLVTCRPPVLLAVESGAPAAMVDFLAGKVRRLVCHRDQVKSHVCWSVTPRTRCTLFWQVTTVPRPGYLQYMKHGGLQVRNGRGTDANEADEAGNTPLTYLLERCANKSTVGAKVHVLQTASQIAWLANSLVVHHSPLGAPAQVL
jgi:hypothetical protein